MDFLLTTHDSTAVTSMFIGAAGEIVKRSIVLLITAIAAMFVDMTLLVWLICGGYISQVSSSSRVVCVGWCTIYVNPNAVSLFSSSGRGSSYSLRFFHLFCGGFFCRASYCRVDQQYLCIIIICYPAILPYHTYTVCYGRALYLACKFFRFSLIGKCDTVTRLLRTSQ